jgi:hypothetical protein
MTLKDGHEVAGLRTTVGAPILDRIADEDGTVASRLHAAGAIIVGHTNVPPWLADHQSANPIFGRTADPWNHERTPGGSSGGAAAALAAGMTPLEIGSDMVGSIRIPAHFCGVFGLKTTEHRVPLTGFFRPPGGRPRSVRVISCLGPMARDLGDLELALSIIAGPDGYDSDVPPVALAREPRRSLDGLRLAVAPTLPAATASASVRHQLERVADQAADAGAKVEERLPDLDWSSLYQLFGDLLGTITGVFDPTSDLRDEQRQLAWYLEALDRRDRHIAACQTFFDDFDALITLPALTAAFPHCPPGTPIDVDGQGGELQRQRHRVCPVEPHRSARSRGARRYRRRRPSVGIQIVGRTGPSCAAGDRPLARRRDSSRFQVRPATERGWSPRSASCARATLSRLWRRSRGLFMTTYVLVHGAWSGAHGFHLVRPLLHADGHEVFTPSLTGIGERVHLVSPQVDLTTHINDVVNHVLYEDLDDIVLLGFSYGGMVVTGSLAHIASRKAPGVSRRLVPGDGDSVLGPLRRPMSPIGLSDPWLAPPTPRTSTTRRNRVRIRARSSSDRCFTEPVRLRQPLEDFPFARTYIRATADAPDAPGTAVFDAAAARARNSTAWQYHEIATNHMIPNNRPKELADLLLKMA